MLTNPQFLAANLAEVNNRIALAAREVLRSPRDVTLVAVSKTQPPEVVALARAAGATDFGENYVQEALAKQAAVPREGTVWHFIGQLQSNKTRQVAEAFDWVHTVDRLKLAQRLAEHRPPGLPPLNVLLQVMVAPEPGKGGVAPAELVALADAVARLPRLKLRGLMCIPPPTEDESLARRHFRRLHGLKDELNAAGHSLDCLSMGMSADYVAAILEGATHVRVGTAVFGARRNSEPTAATP